MENLHVDLAFTAAAIGTGIAGVGVLRAVERHAIERARRRTKDILARLGREVSSGLAGGDLSGDRSGEPESSAQLTDGGSATRASS